MAVGGIYFVLFSQIIHYGSQSAPGNLARSYNVLEHNQRLERTKCTEFIQVKKS
jgi:hypothetical protein